MQVLAGLAPSSRTVGSLVRKLSKRIEHNCGWLWGFFVFSGFFSLCDLKFLCLALFHSGKVRGAHIRPALTMHTASPCHSGLC